MVLVSGIFGTFLGVSYALFSFSPDSEQISKSIPSLISGLQSAFITSVFGLMSNIYLRLTEKNQVSTDNVGEELINSIKILNKAISDDNESSLISQLKLLRQENKDGIFKLNNSFEDFAEKMVEDNSKSLIEALEKVITDFNTKISEQLEIIRNSMNH